MCLNKLTELYECCFVFFFQNEDLMGLPTPHPPLLVPLVLRKWDLGAARWRGRHGDSWTLRCSRCPLTSSLPTGVMGTAVTMETQTLDPCPKSSLLFLGTQTLRCHCCCSTRLKENKNLKWTITLNTRRLTRYFIGLRILLQYIVTISTGSWLQPADARSSHLKNLWTKPGQHPCTLNPVEHTNYMYLFIYHVCMLGMKRVIIYIED